MGTNDGALKVALVANLDKDPAKELVVELYVSLGTATNTTCESVLLDWNGRHPYRPLGVLRYRAR